MSLIGLIGLIALMGCSKDSAEVDVPQTQERAITFSGALQDDEEVTRADQPLSDLTHTFSVWGYKNDGYDSSTDTYTSYQTVMPGYVVNWAANSANTTTSNTNNWEYVGLTNYPQQTIKYWDFDANAYRFFGVAAGTGSGATVPTGAYMPTGTTATTGATGYQFTATVDASTQAGVDAAPYFSELWFSTGNPVDYADKQFGQPVKLRFVKPFARVRFLFTFAEDLHSTRADMAHIRFLPNTPQTIARAGIVSVAYPLKGTGTEARWSTSNTTGISAFTIDWYEDPGTPASDTDPETYPNSPCHWYTVLPADAQGDYAVEMSLVTSEIRRAVVPAQYMRWQAGYQYTYQFKVTTGGGIVFDRIQIGINEWTEAQGGNKQHAVYNW